MVSGTSASPQQVQWSYRTFESVTEAGATKKWQTAAELNICGQAMHLKLTKIANALFQWASKANL